MSIKPWRRRQTGTTLIELIVFIVIVSIAVAGVLQVFNLATKFSANPLSHKQALAIAESLLEEVELARFTYCDPTDAVADSATSPSSCTDATYIENVGQEAPAKAAGIGRPFDNVNDYVTSYGVEQLAFNNAIYDAKGVLSDASGDAIPVTGYVATLTITPQALGSITSDATPANNNVLHIQVKVTYGLNNVTLDGYRTRYAPTAVP